MESLIELILDNPFLLFIIIAGVVSFFSRLTSTTNPEESQENSERETTRHSPVRDVMKRMQEMAELLDPEMEKKKHQQEVEAKKKAKESKEKVERYSFEQQREEQYKRLKEQFQTNSSTDDTDETIAKDSPIFKETESEILDGTRQTQVKVNLKSKLEAGGIIESVIMSEILGPPRARKRYNSRYFDR